ncbi:MULTISPECIES: solute symporter family protein [unclassified Rhodococcus (in: high G+C Gram-positive bacteria)]|uniref:solute symporter family protein n=1 Tax=unclassified Rhodococcus (in: high G+C Gram-positive bacteria) TaxID=192944 RepID=UPI00096A6E89|nr:MULTISPECIES: cation acetate symporter [unclassified Rhodococcus (in: high G+C Gram-positive bacteria)]
MSVASGLLFGLLVAVTLLITWWAAKKNKTAADHYVAGGRLSGRQNGVAIAGDFISAASFLGVTGAIALSGFNGFYLAVFVPVAFLLALLVVAEPLRNLGRFTLADVLATRFVGPSVRSAMATSTVVISVVYLVAQLVGAALIISLLFDFEYYVAVLIIGALTTLYTLLGGMLATTWIQIIKTVLLIGCAIALFLLVVIRFDANPFGPFAAALSEFGESFVGPSRTSDAASFDQVSQVVGLVLGVLGLPHVMIRFLTVPDGKQARSSATTAIWIFFAFYLMVPILGYGAANIVGQEAIAQENKGGNLAVAQLAESLGGGLLLAFVAAVAFVTILAALSGLVIATSGAIAHDLYGQVMRRGNVSDAGQHRAARIATVLTCGIGIVIALAAGNQNVAFLASLGMSIAACANLPALMLTMYWRRMTAQAVIAGIVTGLVLSLAIILASPAVHGSSALLSFSNPALVVAPISLVVSIVVALATAPKGERADQADATYDDMRITALTGRAARSVGDSSHAS